jgi:hypothetical protein
LTVSVILVELVDESSRLVKDVTSGLTAFVILFIAVVASDEVQGITKNRADRIPPWVTHVVKFDIA